MITRCKDCVYAVNMCQDEYACGKFDTYGVKTWTEGNDFCSKGRRTLAEGFDNDSIVNEMEKEIKKKRKRFFGL